MKNKNVLIVDDNDLNRRLFENLIGRLWEFESAKNGLEATERAHFKPFDLILMDIQMPVMDGVTAMKKIRSEKLATCPIVAITAYADESDRSYFLKEGFDYFMTKPIRPKEFLNELGQILKENEISTEISINSIKLDKQIFDFEVFNSLCKYQDRKSILGIYREFIEEAAGLLDESKQDLLIDKLTGIAEKCHTIKGNSGTLGINNLYEASKKAEGSAKNGEWMRTELALEDVGKELTNFKMYFEEVVLKSIYE